MVNLHKGPKALETQTPKQPLGLGVLRGPPHKVTNFFGRRKLASLLIIISIHTEIGENGH